MVASTIKASSNASIFQAKDECAGYTIDCSVNPYDLRPAADLIIEAAGRMRAELAPGTPQVILMGEKHTCSAHIELQHMVAAKMQAQGQRFCMGYELSANTLANVMATNMPDIGSLDSESILNLDRDGTASLLAYMTGCVVSDDAPVAQRNLMAFCYAHKIPSIFNDAARDFDQQGALFLDMDNPLNAAAAKFCGVTKKGEIRIFGVGGIGIRNRVMARRGVDFAAQHGVDTIVQNTGLSHVLGRRYSNFDISATSLTETYRAAGAAVLPVFIAGDTHNDAVDTIPVLRRHHLAHGVVIHGLASDIFGEESEEGAEQKFITEKLHRHSGGLIQCFDAGKNMKRNIAAIQKSCDQILRHYHADILRHKASLSA